MSQESGHAATNNPSSAVILGLDASGDQASVALWRDGVVVDRLVHTARHGHAATLIPMARDLLAAHECAFTALTHIAGGTGPGSFTGIRVALAGAKGLCIATGATGIGVSVLSAQAHHAAHEGINKGRPMLLLADTRRGGVYGQFFDSQAESIGTIFESEPTQIADHVPAQLMEQQDAIMVAGANGDLCADTLGGAVMHDIGPADAGHIAAFAASLLDQVTHPGLTPLYLAPAFLGPKKPA